MRAIERRDLEELRLLHNHPDTLRFLTDATFVTTAMQEAWFAKLGGGSNRHYVIEDAEGLVGLVRISDFQPVNQVAVIGLDITPERRGQGLGARSYGLLLKYCFEEMNLRVVWMQVAAFNERALNLYKKLGFERTRRIPEALFRNGTHYDVLILTLTRADWTKRAAQKQDGE